MKLEIFSQKYKDLIVAEIVMIRVVLLVWAWGSHPNSVCWDFLTDHQLPQNRSI